MKKKGIEIELSPALLLYFVFALGLGAWLKALSYVLTVIFHELIHYLAAVRRGYECKRLEIGLFGAVLYGDFEILSVKDEVFVALSAPLCNLLVGVVLTAGWWAFPESYAYTSELAFANFGMALGNLLPCYPLDGGRAYTAALRAKISRKKVFSALRKMNFAFGIALIATFFITIIKSQANFSLLIFSFSLICDGFLKKVTNPPYSKTTFESQREKLLKKGAAATVLSFGADVPLYAAYKECGSGRLWLIDIYRAGKRAKTVTIFELERAVFSCPAGTTLEFFLK